MTEPRRHPNDADLYTPITPELLELFERMRAEHGTWRKVAAVTGLKLRVLRRIRRGGRKAISQRLLDRIITTSGVGGLHEFTWFTANDLVALGIWDPVHYAAGYARIQGENVHFRTKDEMEKAKKQAKESRKRRMRIKKRAARK